MTINTEIETERFDVAGGSGEGLRGRLSGTANVVSYVSIESCTKEAQDGKTKQSKELYKLFRYVHTYINYVVPCLPVALKILC